MIARVDKQNKPHILLRERVPLRFGTDAFQYKYFRKETFKYAKEVFLDFKKKLNDYKVKEYRAFATSAFRDSMNAAELSAYIKKHCSIEIKTISGKKEAELIQKGVKHFVDLSHRDSIIIDIGGGSVELIKSHNERILDIQSLDIGTVRLLKLFKEKPKSDVLKNISKDFEAFVQKNINHLKHHHLSIIGSGGNLRRMGKLRKKILGKRSAFKITHKELLELIEILDQKKKKQLIDNYQITSDRAEVIIPAMLIIDKFLELQREKTLLLPPCGLGDGILNEIINDIH